MTDGESDVGHTSPYPVVIWLINPSLRGSSGAARAEAELFPRSAGHKHCLLNFSHPILNVVSNVSNATEIDGYRDRAVKVGVRGDQTIAVIAFWGTLAADAYPAGACIS